MRSPIIQILIVTIPQKGDRAAPTATVNRLQAAGFVHHGKHTVTAKLPPADRLSRDDVTILIGACAAHDADRVPWLVIKVGDDPAKSLITEGHVLEIESEAYKQVQTIRDSLLL